MQIIDSHAHLERKAKIEDMHRAAAEGAENGLQTSSDQNEIAATEMTSDSYEISTGPLMPDSTADTYALSARHYDAAYAAADLVDVPFYLDLARGIGGPVLEIGCGTGRMLLPIARAGIEIHGLDNSSAMLDVLREKLEREPEEIRRRVTLHAGDMRHARLDRKFPLVLIPFRPRLST